MIVEEKNDRLVGYLMISKMADRTPRMILYPGKELIKFLSSQAREGREDAFSQLLACVRYLHPAATMQEAELKAMILDAVLENMDHYIKGVAA